MANPQLFLIGQKAFIQKGDAVLVLHEPDRGWVDYPGGKIDEGEMDVVAALQREVREETSLEISIGDPFVVWIQPSTKSDESNRPTLYLVGFRCKYLSGNVQLSDEHDDFRWVNKDNYQEVDDGTDWFKAIEKYFSD